MTKRLPLIMMALLACLAVGVATSAAKGKGKSVATTLNVKYKGGNPKDPYRTSTFTGKVGPKKCAKNRKIKIKGAGSEKTDEKGKFSLTLSGPAAPGKYKVTVAPKKVKQTTCKKAKKTVRVASSG